MVEIKNRLFSRFVQFTPSDERDGWRDLSDMDGVYHGQIQFKF